MKKVSTDLPAFISPAMKTLKVLGEIAPDDEDDLITVKDITGVRDSADSVLGFGKYKKVVPSPPSTSDVKAPGMFKKSYDSGYSTAMDKFYV